MQEFIDKTARDGGTVNMIDAAMLAEIPDIGGTFLLSIKIHFLSQPIQVLSTNTFTTNGDGTAKLNSNLKFLTFPDRMPTGDPLVIDNTAIANTGELTIMRQSLTIPMAANPLARDATAENVRLIGIIKNKDLYCGTAKGAIVNPPAGNLEDGEPTNPTTWAAVRVTDTNNLPAAVIACPSP